MDKLTRVLKLRKQQEQDSAAELAYSQQARAQAEAQQNNLKALTAEYRQQHAGVVQDNVHRFRQFQRFYAQLNAAVCAQQEVVAKLAASEAQDARAFVKRHQDRRALEILLQQRDLTHKTERLKAERRSHRRLSPKPMV